MRRHAVRSVIVAVALLFLIASAFVNGFRWGKQRTKLGELIVYTRRAEAVEMQYRVADPASAESALRGFLGMCDDLLASDNELLTKSEIARDQTLTLARLHRIRLAAKDDRGASSYLEGATRSCAAAGWRDCTPAGILAALDQSESHVPDTGAAREH